MEKSNTTDISVEALTEDLGIKCTVKDTSTNEGNTIVVKQEPVPKKSIIEEITDKILSIKDEKIRLLRESEVIKWLHGDLSFLPSPSSTKEDGKKKSVKEIDEENQKNENTWGRTTLKKYRPDLKLEGQWTNRFGEYIAEEIYRLLNKNCTKPELKDHYQPDHEIDNAIIEVKTQTFYTTGTAGEKILGCPFKYANIPSLYGKPLRIICLGGAEKISRDQYGNLPGTKCTAAKQAFLDFYKSNGIEFIAATELLKEFVNLKSTPH